jgi:hypothetical protein
VLQFRVALFAGKLTLVASKISFGALRLTALVYGRRVQLGPCHRDLRFMTSGGPCFRPPYLGRRRP